MAEFKLNTREFDMAVDMALVGTVEFLQKKISEITPRDLDRLPQSINRKD